MPIINVDPTSFIRAFSKSTIPNGYLVCDGSAISRVLYPGLFSLLGTIFGIGDGSTTFNLPDLRGKARIGAGQDSFNSLSPYGFGGYLGEETHQIVLSELSTHDHGSLTDTSSDAHTHTGSVNSTSGLNHNHPYNNSGGGSGNNDSHASEWTHYETQTSGTANISLVHNHSVSLAAIANTHTHSATTNVGALTATATPHNNMMPSLALVMCIKY